MKTFIWFTIGGGLRATEQLKAVRVEADTIDEARAKVCRDWATDVEMDEASPEYADALSEQLSSYGSEWYLQELSDEVVR